MSETEVTLVVAAQRLGLGYQRTLNAVLRGELRGRQDERGKWMVDSKDLERLKAARAARIAKAK